MRRTASARALATRFRVCLLALLLAIPQPAAAADDEHAALVIDPARSEARFYLKAPRHGVEGRSRGLEGGVRLGDGVLSDARGGHARLEVATLHAGNRLIDRNMRGALEADRHPEIVFEATRFEPGDGPDDPGGPRGDAATWRGVVTGDLTVRGVTRPVSFDVEASRQGATLTASGSAVFKLTDFGIEPPRFLGFLRVKDWVRVEFDVTAATASPPGGPIASPPEGP